MRLAGHAEANGLLRLSELIVSEEYCINLRGRVEYCSACEDNCPSDAISLSMDSVDLNASLCTGCNACLPSCPVGVFRSTGFIPKRFVAALAGKRQVHLHCRGSIDGGGGVVIPCHAVLDARLIAAVSAEGVEKLHLHGLDRCAQCGLGDPAGHVESLGPQLKAWLGDRAPVLILDPPQGETDTKEPRHYQDQVHLNRRDFLRFGGAKTATQALEWLVPAAMEEEAEALPFYQSDEFPQQTPQYQRELALRAVRLPWREEAVKPFIARSVTQQCSACLICAERCPTGALQARVTPEARQLGFDPVACTDCSLCERICPEDAILKYEIHEVEPESFKPTTLMFRRHRQCSRCGATFLPLTLEEEICPTCNNEQDLDEEWLEMLSG